MIPGQLPLAAEPYTSRGQELRARLVQALWPLLFVAFLLQFNKPAHQTHESITEDAARVKAA